jgi:hypothetical protein
MARMDLRIGIAHAPRELTVELADDIDRDALLTTINAALTGAVDVLWVTDKRDRRVGVASEKIAYVELGSADGARKMGFVS